MNSVNKVDASTEARINGRQVFIHKGKEIPANIARSLAAEGEEVLERVNGPHHDAKWAKHLLGTGLTRSEWRRRNTLSLR
jgi:hypothetical protein